MKETRQALSERLQWKEVQELAPQDFLNFLDIIQLFYPGDLQVRWRENGLYTFLCCLDFYFSYDYYIYIYLKEF